MSDYSAEERLAWDHYLTTSCVLTDNYGEATARTADTMMTMRRKRFGERPDEAERVKIDYSGLGALLSPPSKL